MKKIIFLSMVVLTLLLQGIIALPFQTAGAHAKESKKYYEEEEEDDDVWERQTAEQYAQPSQEIAAQDISAIARQQAFEQQLEEQQAAQQRAWEEQQNVLLSAGTAQAGVGQVGEDLAYFSDADQDGIEDAVDPHPGESEAIYDVRDEDRDGISDELESNHAVAWR